MDYRTTRTFMIIIVLTVSQHKKLLGLTTDRELLLEMRVGNTWKAANRKLSTLGRFSNFMPLHQQRTVFKTFNESQFKYWIFHQAVTA